MLKSRGDHIEILLLQAHELELPYEDESINEIDTQIPDYFISQISGTAQNSWDTLNDFPHEFTTLDESATEKQDIIDGLGAALAAFGINEVSTNL